MRKYALLFILSLVFCLTLFLFTKISQTYAAGSTLRVDSGYDFDPTISTEGRYVAFVTGYGGFQNVFVKDIITNTTEMVSVASDGTPGNNDSGFRPAISADGRYVAFMS